MSPLALPLTSPSLLLLPLRGGTPGRTICSLWWPSTTRSTSARGVRSWPGRPCMQVGCTGKAWGEGRAGEWEGIRLVLQVMRASGRTAPRRSSVSLFTRKRPSLSLLSRGTFSRCLPAPPPLHTPAYPATGLPTPLASSRRPLPLLLPSPRLAPLTLLAPPQLPPPPIIASPPLAPHCCCRRVRRASSQEVPGSAQ